MNTSNYLLSIITINKNNSIGLKRTIRSVINQSFKNFEYLIIDGASTDGSQEIAKNIALINLKLISEPDTGIYKAMNKGIQIASGDYLLFLNSGDFLVNNNVLEEVFSVPRIADLLLGGCNISGKGKIVHTIKLPPRITFGNLYYQGLPHQSAFIKREVFEKYGLYREEFKYNADIEFWYRTIVLNGCSTETLSTIVSDYNLEGISSKENNSEAYRKELDEIYAHPVLRRFIPDYEDWKREREEMKIMYWAKSKPVLYLPIKWLFHIAPGFHKIRK